MLWEERVSGDVLLPLLCSFTVRWKQNGVDRGGQKAVANDVKTHTSLRGEMRSRRRELVVVANRPSVHASSSHAGCLLLNELCPISGLELALHGVGR